MLEIVTQLLEIVLHSSQILNNLPTESNQNSNRIKARGVTRFLDQEKQEECVVLLHSHRVCGQEGDNPEAERLVSMYSLPTNNQDTHKFRWTHSGKQDWLSVQNKGLPPQGNSDSKTGQLPFRSRIHNVSTCLAGLDDPLIQCLTDNNNNNNNKLIVLIYHI